VSRIIAIGDIHGCSTALAALIELIAPCADDTIITLGDYVDRGIDSKGVLDLLIDLADRCRLIPILGNHDEMMLHAKDGRDDFRFWLNCGGDAALDSYGLSRQLDLIPAAHFRFLERCVRLHETDTHFFVHANYNAGHPLAWQTDHALRWVSLRDYMPGPHCSGKIAIMGHTPQPDVLNLGHLICLDTGCCNGGWLTAMEFPSQQMWQVNESGQLRSR
jgi:serine/threonine protein phosphatase 1